MKFKKYKSIFCAFILRFNHQCNDEPQIKILLTRYFVYTLLIQKLTRLLIYNPLQMPSKIPPTASKLPADRVGSPINN